MAAPPEITLKNLTGNYVMNKKQSTDPDPILQLQGVGWILRKAIGLGTITLSIKQYTDGGVEKIDIEQTGTGGVKGTTEKRTLDNEEHAHEDHIFGSVKGRSRWIKLSDVDDEFLKTGFRPECDEGEVIESYVESVNNGWTANQIWGFQDVEGERRYARHVVVKKGNDVKHATLIYDYKA